MLFREPNYGDSKAGMHTRLAISQSAIYIKNYRFHYGSSVSLARI